MKKLVIDILLFVFTLCVGVGIFGCKKEFSDEGREYIEDYGYIHTLSLEKGNIELHVENTICDSREEMERIFTRLEGDYNALEDVFDLKTKVKVYVIEDGFVFGGTHGAYIDERVYCDLDSVESGDYRVYFTGAYLDAPDLTLTNTTEPWKYYGVSEYVFGEPSDDTEALNSYYSNAGDLLTLTMFAAYFNDSFADEQTFEIAKKTAKAFTKYVIDAWGKKELLAAGFEAYRQDWLTAIGVDKIFNIPYDLSWLDGAEYSRKLLQYPLVITTDNRTYYLEGFSANRESAAFDTPERVLKHLSEGYASVAEIVRYIGEQTDWSEEAQYIRNRFDGTYGEIEYYISDRETGTEANASERKIYLLDPSEYVHETVHVLTICENMREGAWLAEGVAEYFSREICDFSADIDHRMYLSFTEGAETGALSDFVKDVKARYISIGGTFASFEEFEFHLLEKAIAYVTLTKSEYKNNIRFPYATVSVADTRNLPPTGYEGNDLTYPEAYLFTGYLIERYGLKNTLSCCRPYDFSKVFGESYVAVFNNFTEALSRSS